MADISMQYSGIEATVREICQMQTDFSDMLINLNSLMRSMDGIWEGKAQQEFALAYSKLKPKLVRIEELLGDYCTELTDLISRQQNLEKTIHNQNMYLSF